MISAKLATHQNLHGNFRKLLPTESVLFRDHLLRLDPDSRRLRFANSVPDDYVAAYALKAGRRRQPRVWLFRERSSESRRRIKTRQCILGQNCGSRILRRDRTYQSRPGKRINGPDHSIGAQSRRPAFNPLVPCRKLADAGHRAKVCSRSPDRPRRRHS